jgi:hypothetical protein
MAPELAISGKFMAPDIAISWQFMAPLKDLFFFSTCP